MQKLRGRIGKQGFWGIGALIAGVCGVVGMMITATPQTLAQPGTLGVCGDYIRLALQSAGTHCESIGRNQACYGNTLGQVSMRDNAEMSPWVELGDTADLTRISSLSLSPMNPDLQEWGISIMQVQASLPDTLPGQNVMAVLFGDTVLENAAPDTVELPARTRQAANIRRRPTSTSWQLGALARGEQVTVTGQTTTEAGEVWLQIKYDPYRTRTGWVLANLVDVNGLNIPPVSEDSLVYGAMQAFYLKTGLGVPQCAQFPNNGIILQTPEDAGLISLNINGANLSLGSTALLTLSPTEQGDMLNILLLEGKSLVETGGRERVLIPGSQTSILLDEAGYTIGQPSEARDYDPLDLEPYRDFLLQMGVELPAPARNFNDEWDTAIDGEFGAEPGDIGYVPSPSERPVWVDNGGCDNPPPSWANAHGWHQRCSGGVSVSPPSGNNGGGGGNGRGRGDKGDDDDDDDD